MRVLKIIILLVTSLFFLTQASISLAVAPGHKCDPADPVLRDCDKDGQNRTYSCQPGLSSADPPYFCQPDAFGKIKPPDALAGFLKADPTGAGFISSFLTRLIALIFALAGIVALFMIIWGAFEWITSGGEKEKVAAARNRIIYAIIGIILLSLTFAILRVIGQFTRFRFFTGQTGTYNCIKGYTLDTSKNPPVCFQQGSNLPSTKPAIVCTHEETFNYLTGKCAR